MSKTAIFLLSGVQDFHHAAAFHALTYAHDLKTANIDVKLVFDGAGTGWITEWAKPESRLHQLFEEVKTSGLIDGVCEFCIGHYGNKELAQKEGLAMLCESQGHPNIARYVSEGYQIIVI
ncbi:MAG: DsrE family protein [Candidatus Tectomicrobia bacterium]|uniref:DsrE family protein n=1 Tax=Tectimicrobiota bacterium TaxID=2528274 RepID=A0A933GLS6_UNCTE|nr:DsrE family protein [Candidatus Tectomicrobia bacterium]